MVIDVIIPVFNGAKYIKRCVESVIKNRHQCDNDIVIQITVIDDGSTDQTVDIVKQINLNDGSVAIISQKNSGVASARNHGLSKTNGDYVLFLDSDDWLPKNAIRDMIKSAEKNNADIVIGKLRYFVGKMPVSTTSGTWRKINSEIINPYDNNFLVEINPGIGAKLFKRKMFESLRFPKHRIKWEDLALIPALLANAERISYVDEVVYNYAIHENTTVRDFLVECNVMDIIKSLDILKENLQKTGIYDKSIHDYQSILTLHTLFRVENTATWLKVDASRKECITNELIHELNLRYPNWRNDPILTDPNRRYKDPLFNLVVNKVLNRIHA